MKERPGQRPKLLTYIALILIILTIILLGLNRVLTTDHCATLLAAIAGYVLGRAGQRQVITTEPGKMRIEAGPVAEKTPETEPVTKSPQKDSKKRGDSNENVQEKDT
jgi:hypothetical protein